MPLQLDYQTPPPAPRPVDEKGEWVLWVAGGTMLFVMLLFTLFR